MRIATLGIDLGKNTIHVVGLDESGHLAERKKLTRTSLIRFLAKLAPCQVAMEACAGSHHVARKAEAMGHRPVILPGQFVQAYTKGQKNDEADAAAIAEAATRPTMPEVTVKDATQQEIQFLHRSRQGWIKQRTETANRVRAMLLEFGITVPKKMANLRKALPTILEDAENGLPDGARDLIAQHWHQLQELDDRVTRATQQLNQLARQDARTARLLTVPGIGPMLATAFVAAVGDGSQFAKGRDCSAWVGLVPQQFTTGGKPRLLGISKRGNRYLRTLLVHGARALLRHAHRHNDALRRWIRQLDGRTHANKAAVALANKLTRVAWAVLTRGEEFRSEAAAA
ncbi:IS110 family transposase [Thiohalorhabdus methylotrophus]|uniref:IS110 family transposase n=1 Tax=Thiohalorhabdus methylotrophus TaxID=3242694 RepID=A0ABV4TRU1_9GAMM